MKQVTTLLALVILSAVVAGCATTYPEMYCIREAASDGQVGRLVPDTV